MCRMLAIISRKPLPTHYLKDFGRLAEDGRVSESAQTPGHKDGWGIVHIDGQPEYLGHKAFDEDGAIEANADTSTEYDRVCTDIERRGLNGIFLAHLRRASSGKKVLMNTAPFIKDGWVFSHNGTVYNLHNGDESDSRILFKMLVEEMVRNNNAEEGIRSVAEKIRSPYGKKYTSLTFLLSDGESLYAYRDYYKQDADYYSLKYAFMEDSTLIFSQEETWNLDWNIISNRSLIIAGREPRIKEKISI